MVIASGLTSGGYFICQNQYMSLFGPIYQEAHPQGHRLQCRDGRRAGARALVAGARAGYARACVRAVRPCPPHINPSMPSAQRQTTQDRSLDGLSLLRRLPLGSPRPHRIEHRGDRGNILGKVITRSGRRHLPPLGLCQRPESPHSLHPAAVPHRRAVRPQVSIQSSHGKERHPEAP